MVWPTLGSRMDKEQNRTITVRNQPIRPTQPCIPPGSLNRVPASAGGKGWNVTSVGWQVTLCDPIWHVNSSSGESTSVSELLYPCYFTLLLLYSGARVREHLRIAFVACRVAEICALSSYLWVLVFIS